MRRSWLVGIIVAVIVIVLGLIIGAQLLNVNKYKPRIEAELQSKLGRPVQLGTLHLSLFPLGVKVDGMTVGAAPGEPQNQPFAKASEVYVRVGLFSLIGGSPDIKDLTLDRPQIELVRNSAGVWNFTNMGGTSSGGSSGTKSTGGQSGFSLDKLKITDGQVAVTNQQTNAPRTVYDHIDLTLSGLAPGKQVDVAMTAHFPGQGKEVLEFSGKAGPFGTGSQQIPVNGHASLQQVSLAGLNGIANGAIPPKTDASMSGAAQVSTSGDTVNCKGDLKLDNPVVQGAKVPYPIEAQYDLGMDEKQNQIQIHSGNVKLGPTAVAISGSINEAAKPAGLNLKVKTQNASITDLARLASAFGVAFDANDQVKGSLSADLAVTGPMNAPALDGNLSASTLQAQDITLKNVQAKCKMSNGLVQLAPVTAGLFGGQENGTITVDTRPAHPLCTVNTNLTGIDTNALLSAVSSMKNTLYGQLAANANLSFGLDAGPNLARTLNGTVDFNVANGQLKNVNIMSEVGRVGKFLNPGAATASKDTSLQKLAGKLNIQNGVASTNNLVAAMPEGSLSGTGNVNLATEAIDMHVNAVLASGTSKAVGGNQIGGFLSTVLANNKGELVVPVNVGGTMDHPVFTPDVQAMAKMKMSHLLPTSGDPSKATSGVVGSVLGAVTGQQQQGNNQKQNQNPVNSLLNQLGKKK